MNLNDLIKYGIIKKDITISAGFAIFNNSNKILLLKPTGTGLKDNMWTIPKGHVDINDNNIISTAIRETYEECGIQINTNEVDDKEFFLISYKDKKDKIYKYIVVFFYNIDSNINYIEENMLQLEEVEKGIFYNIEEAKDKIFYKQKPLINYIIENKLNKK